MNRQGIIGQDLGFIPQAPSNGTATLAQSANATWIAFSFIGNGKTLDSVDLFTSALTGSLTAAQLTLDIYSNGTNGLPNASVAGPVNCGASPIAGWNQWTGLSYATTNGVAYWAVVKNSHGTPASNFVTFQYGASGTAPNYCGAIGSTNYAWSKIHSTDSGSTWAGTHTRGTFSIKLSYSDTTYDGLPFSTVATETTNMVYAAREIGNRFTTPPIALPVCALRVWISSNTGTPTNPLRGRLWTDASTVYTTDGTLKPGAVSGGWNTLYFPSTITIPASTLVRATLGTTGSDTSSNAYRTHLYTIKDDSASRALMPCGDMYSTYTTDGSVGTPTWSDTNTKIMPIELMLDQGALSAGGGGGGAYVIGG